MTFPAGLTSFCRVASPCCVLRRLWPPGARGAALRQCRAPGHSRIDSDHRGNAHLLAFFCFFLCSGLGVYLVRLRDHLPLQLRQPPGNVPMQDPLCCLRTQCHMASPGLLRDSAAPRNSARTANGGHGVANKAALNNIQRQGKSAIS